MVAEDSGTYDTWLDDDGTICKLEKYGFSKEEAKKLFEALLTKQLDAECLTFKSKFEMEFPNTSMNVMHMMIPKEKRYTCINISKNAVGLLKLILSVLNPISTITDVIVYLYSLSFKMEPEEACIYGYIKEMESKNKSNIIVIDEFVNIIQKNSSGICNNKDFQCKYSNNGECTMEEVKLNKILDMLVERNIIKRFSDRLEIIEKV